MTMFVFPKNTIPYYIYAPSYTYTSSGVRVLHLLCHILNKSGYKAFLCPDNGKGYSTHPHLDTPILQPQFENFYNSNNINPIIIYPDIVKGNPFNGRKIVRYLLAPVGKYGGDAVFPVTDKVYGYRSDIATPALCLPTFDTSIFYSTQEKRSGSCFYSHKYELHGNKPEERGIRLEGTPQKIASILRKSEVCYVYEMSEIIVLAKLCGCPVAIVETEYFSQMPVPWDFDGTPNHWWTRFYDQLTVFIEDTQNWKEEKIH